MLVIRMQRTGRKGHAQFRIVVQDSRRTPSSGKVVAQLGSFDPHTKHITLNKEVAQVYLDNGAQPTERTARLLAGEGVKLPNWVKTASGKTGSIRHPEKLRRNRPAEEAAPEAAPAEAVVANEAAEEQPAEATAEAEVPAAPVEAPTETEPATETPADTEA